MFVALGLGCATSGPPPAPAPTADPVTAELESDGAPAPSSPAAAAESEDDAVVASIQEGPYDPLEPVNRGLFYMNRGIDAFLLDPLTEAYVFVVPEVARIAVRRVFSNLNAAQVLVNDVLQLQFGDASVTAARFAINTTLGLAGILDPASRLGLQRHDSDFGETLARVGIGPGPYLVLPLFGPTTIRDSVGDAVDGVLRPQFWLLGFGSGILLDSGAGLSQREEHHEELKELRSSSVDYYAALRSAYWLDREGELRARLARSADAGGEWSLFWARARGKPDVGQDDRPVAVEAAPAGTGAALPEDPLPGLADGEAPKAATELAAPVAPLGAAASAAAPER